MTYRERVSFKGTSEGAQLIEYAAKHPGVRFVVIFLAHADLRGQVIWCPQ